MEKKAAFFIDDVIWVFRDLTRQRPRSLWDNPYMAMFKKAHDEYGVKTQLNLFYRTSFYYGDDEFSLADMTDAYKAEFEAASDWLKLGFHSKEEFPDYPFINADYSTVDNVFRRIYNEICRFAGAGSFAKSVVPHWIPISKEGLRALADNGICVTYASYGVKGEWDGNHSSLPYGWSARLLQNKKPESSIYQKHTMVASMTKSLCSYNHISEEEHDAIATKLATVKDKELDMCYMPSAHMILNNVKLPVLENELSKYVGNEFISVGNHEQYFYPDYYAYQPDYAEKIYTMGKVLRDAGYSFMFMEELPTNG